MRPRTKMQWQLKRVPRRPGWSKWLVLCTVLWLATIGTASVVAQHSGVSAPGCMFKTVTSMPCPTCGSTRGSFCMLSGRPWEAWAHNLMVFTALAVFAGAVVLRVLFARKIDVRLTRTERRCTWGLAVTVFVANWAYVILYVG